MKIILTQDVKKVGKKGDLLEVKDGYARNALLPKGLAVEANAVNLNHRQLEQKAEDKRKQHELEEAQNIAAVIDNKEIKLAVKTGEGGKVFGSVTSKEIAEEIYQKYNVKVDKKKIQLKEVIKGLGGQKVTIKLHANVSATINLIVVGA